MAKASQSEMGHRLAPRVAMWGAVGFLVPPNETVAGRLRDLSLTGIKAVTAQPLPIGTMVDVMLPLAAGDVPQRLRAEVVWSQVERRSAACEYLNGLKVGTIEPATEARVRQFIDSRIWSTLDCLGRMPVLSDFNDLERLSLSAICLSFDLQPGDELNANDMDGGVALVQRGSIAMRTLNEHGKPIQSMSYGDGEIAGSPLSDPSETSCQWVAETRTQVVVIPNEGLDHLRTSQPQMAVKLLTAYCSTLERKLRRLQNARW